jgi:hypothetical protein
MGLQEDPVPSHQGTGQAAQAEDARDAAVKAAENCIDV